MLSGVCGGIAEYFNIDSTIVRLLAIALFAEGIGVFLYFACWIIIPEAPSSGSYSFNDGNADNAYSDDKGFSTDEVAKPDTGNGQKIIGFGLIALGLIILIDKDSLFSLETFLAFNPGRFWSCPGPQGG